MNKTPKVAFVIVCWNNASLLNDCFDSISDQSYSNHTTIMVDNGSSDDSVAVARRIAPKAEIIETGRNNGFAKGNNIGMKKALEDEAVEYVALINTDARLDKDWLKRLVDFAAKKPKAACLQGTTLKYDDKNMIDSTHLFVNQSGQAVQGHWDTYFYRDIGPKKVFGVNAAACLISRKFIETQPFAKFFDETMFMYMEDVDIAVRATTMGWDNYLVDGATAYHMGSGSSGGGAGTSNYGLYMTFRNNLGMVVKNFPWTIIFKILRNMPRADFRTIRHLNRLSHKVGAKKVIQGRLVSLVRLPIYLWQRYKLRGYRNVDKDYLWQLMGRGE